MRTMVKEKKIQIILQTRRNAKNYVKKDGRHYRIINSEQYVQIFSISQPLNDALKDEEQAQQNIIKYIHVSNLYNKI